MLAIKLPSKLIKQELASLLVADTDAEAITTAVDSKDAIVVMVKFSAATTSVEAKVTTDTANTEAKVATAASDVEAAASGTNGANDKMWRANRPDTLARLSTLGFWLSPEGLPSVKIFILTSRFQIYCVLRSNLLKKRSDSVALSNLMFINLKCYDHTISESDSYVAYH